MTGCRMQDAGRLRAAAADGRGSQGCQTQSYRTGLSSEVRNPWRTAHARGVSVNTQRVAHKPLSCKPQPCCWHSRGVQAVLQPVCSPQTLPINAQCEARLDAHARLVRCATSCQSITSVAVGCEPASQHIRGLNWASVALTRAGACGGFQVPVFRQAQEARRAKRVHPLFP